MAASRVGSLFSADVTSVVSSTTIAAATSVAVVAGDTAFFYLGARGGTTTAQFVTLSGLPGDTVFEGNGSGDIGTLQTSNLGSPANAVIRCYFPTGMTSGTTVTGTWLQSATRKEMQAVVWTGVANANNQARQVSTGSGGTSLGAGTTGATTTTTGVHIAGWALNSTVSTATFTPGNDTEGAMTQQMNCLAGAATFQYGFGEDNTVTAAHAGGETALMNVTAGSVATWCSVQGIWDGAVLVPTQKRVFFPSKARNLPQQRNRSHIAWR